MTSLWVLMTRFAALITTRLPAWPDKLIEAGGNLPGRLFASRTTSPIFDLFMMFSLALNEHGSGHVKATGQHPDLANVEIALATQNLRHHALTSYLRKIGLRQLVLFHQEPQGS